MIDKNVAELNPLLRRALQFLEEGDRGKADDYCEKVLDQEPENAYAYVIKLMIRLNTSAEEDLGNVLVDYGDWSSYRNACRYADDVLQGRLESYLQSTKAEIERREEQKRAEEEAYRQAEDQRCLAGIYAEGEHYLQQPRTKDNVLAAYRCFIKIPGRFPEYESARQKAEECKRLIDALEEQEKQRAYEKELEEKKQRKKKRTTTGILTVVVIALLVLWGARTIQANGEKEAENLKRAEIIEENLQGMSFTGKKTEYVQEDSGMSWSLVREQTEYVVTYTFLGDGQIKVDTVTYYDMEPFITRNGQRVWDSVTDSTKYLDGGEVSISLQDEIRVKIGGQSYVLNVSGSDNPQSIVIGSTTYSRK